MGTRLLAPQAPLAAEVGQEHVAVHFRSGVHIINLEDVDAIGHIDGWIWSRISITGIGFTYEIRGLFRRGGGGISKKVEELRVRWWRRRWTKHKVFLSQVEACIQELADPQRYFRSSAYEVLLRDAQSASSLFSSVHPSLLTEAEISRLESIRAFLRTPEEVRRKANSDFVEGQLTQCRSYFDQVETKPLTDEQRRSVVVDEDHNLVIAAAGSGKTSVIVAKVGWLLHRSYRPASQVLLLAFAKAARTEMQQRLASRLGSEVAKSVTVKTFHALGVEIIGVAEGRRPSLAKSAEDDAAQQNFLRQIIDHLLGDATFATTMLGWFQSYFAPYKSQTDFSTAGEYWAYIRAHDIRSLKGELVKSFEECEIANFFYLNQIEYVYERDYEHVTASALHRQYRPDFYLPEYKLYIEHFALSENGETPEFIDRDSYLAGVTWKRQLHASHGTALIETFSWEKKRNVLLTSLQTKLLEYKVEFRPLSHDLVFDALKQQGRIDPFTRLLGTFLQHFKGNRSTFRQIYERAMKLPGQERSIAFLNVFKRVYDGYQKLLSQRGEIDFHDMINIATEHIEVGRFQSPFRYILVDEFQDISSGRARLLQALLKQEPDAQLFCVGDDWQAIFRFAGSDIALMREFVEHFGPSEQMALQTTFRSVDRLARPATNFILKNSSQIFKDVLCVSQADEPCIQVHFYSGSEVNALEDVLRSISAEAGEGQSASVLLLGRYRHSRPKNLSQLGRRHPALRLEYMTVHRSKGLEADYVVVLGMDSGKLGFPSEILDDPLLDLVLAKPEAYPNAEERRLFYVALTRARRGAVLLANADKASPFVNELLQERDDVKILGQSHQTLTPCPVCKTGRLTKKTGKRGAFFGCSNWPYCEHTEPMCPCGNGSPVKQDARFRCDACDGSYQPCSVCDGWLQWKDGKFGAFLSCSNWPRCDSKPKSTLSAGSGN